MSVILMYFPITTHVATITARTLCRELITVMLGKMTRLLDNLGQRVHAEGGQVYASSW